MKHRLKICVIAEDPCNVASLLAEVLPKYRRVLISEALKNLNTNMIVVGSIPVELFTQAPQEDSVILAVYTPENYWTHRQQITGSTTKDTDIYENLDTTFNAVYNYNEGILTFKRGSRWNGHPYQFVSLESFAKAVEVHWDHYSNHKTMLFVN